MKAISNAALKPGEPVTHDTPLRVLAIGGHLRPGHRLTWELTAVLSDGSLRHFTHVMPTSCEFQPPDVLEAQEALFPPPRHLVKAWEAEGIFCRDCGDPIGAEAGRDRNYRCFSCAQALAREEEAEARQAMEAEAMEDREP